MVGHQVKECVRVYLRYLTRHVSFYLAGIITERHLQTLKCIVKEAAYTTYLPRGTERPLDTSLVVESSRHCHEHTGCFFYF